MREHYRTIIITVLLLVVLGLAVNDGAVVATNYWLADKLAQSIADDAATDYRSSRGDKSTAGATADRLCVENQGTLRFFDIKDGVVTVEIEASPKKTLVAHRIEALRPYLSGKATVRRSTN